MGQANGYARLEDKYFLQKVKLGQGSFGVVWRAVERQNGFPVAVKQMDKVALPKRGVRRQDVEREITVMQAINNENVTRLYDTFEDHQAIYMALEYCDGGDFGDKVKERSMNIREPEAADWVRQICSAVAALHSKGVCHRDIKPDNFMVHGTTLKLTDFGLAIFLPPGQLLQEKCGTPAFMAPEQHHLPRASHGYGYAVDVWAAGVSMYMLMMGGRHPFLVNEQHLDERRLLAGALDFTTPPTVFGIGLPDMGLGMGEGRFSEPARDLCRRLVCPDVHIRLSAVDALRHPWLHNHRRRNSAPPAAFGQPAAQPVLPPQKASPAPQPLPAGAAAAAAAAAAAGEPSPQQVTAAPGDYFAEKLALGAQFFGLGHMVPGAANQGATNEAELQRRVQEQQQQINFMRENLESQYDIIQQLAGEQKQRLDTPAQPQKVPAAEFSKPKTWLPDASAPAGLLPVGAKCRYNSTQYSGWIPCVVSAVNVKDGTYDLDVRPGANPDNMTPSPDVSPAEAWPPGTLVYYKSTSANQWLPAVVQAFNERSGSTAATYNLDVRERADMDRIRPRFP